MINDTSSELPKPQEGQPKERVIELNEWFTPFENYDSLPYNPPGKIDSPEIRIKTRHFQLSNVGKFRTSLWWENYLVDPKYAKGEKYLLILPSSEIIIDGSELKSEQEKMETRPMKIELEFEEEKFFGESLPFNLEVELPSGAIISAPMETGPDDDGPGAFGKWEFQGEEIHGPMVPETENLIGKLNFRFVPKEIN